MTPRATAVITVWTYSLAIERQCTGRRRIQRRMVGRVWIHEPFQRHSSRDLRQVIVTTHSQKCIAFTARGPSAVK